MTNPLFTDESTIGDVRAWLRAQASKPGGATCPACTQHAQVYRRSVNSNMVRLLVRAYRCEGQEWFHATTLRDGTGDVAKLRYWGLVQEGNERRADGGRAGWWRVTDRGVAFLRARLRVPKYALVYDGVLIDHDGAEIDVHDAIAERFNLAELMGEGAGVAPELDSVTRQ